GPPLTVTSVFWIWSNQATPSLTKIGRASCRERVDVSVAATVMVTEAPGATSPGSPKPWVVAQPLPTASLEVPKTTASQTGLAPLAFHVALPVLVRVIA